MTYCTNCRNEINEGENFCSKCGNNVNKENTTNTTSSVVETSQFTPATRESILSISIKVILVMLLFLVPAFFSGNLFGFFGITTILGFGIVALVISWIVRPYIGNCPYCNTKVKSNKIGFTCPQCMQNIAIRNSKFFRLKNGTNFFNERESTQNGVYNTKQQDNVSEIKTWQDIRILLINITDQEIKSQIQTIFKPIERREFIKIFLLTVGITMIPLLIFLIIEYTMLAIIGIMLFGIIMFAYKKMNKKHPKLKIAKENAINEINTIIRTKKQ